MQTSPGMVAFGDMILFVLVTGFFSLAPTWFLLKLLVEKAPRALLATELLIAAMGPVSWLAMTALAVTTPVPLPPRCEQPVAVRVERNVDRSEYVPCPLAPLYALVPPAIW